MDEEEDEDWRHWGAARPVRKLPPPPDLSRMDPAVLQAELLRHHAGPSLGFVKLRPGDRRSRVRGSLRPVATAGAPLCVGRGGSEKGISVCIGRAGEMGVGTWEREGNRERVTGKNGIGVGDERERDRTVPAVNGRNFSLLQV